MQAGGLPLRRMLSAGRCGGSTTMPGAGAAQLLHHYHRHHHHARFCAARAGDRHLTAGPWPLPAPARVEVPALPPHLSAARSLSAAASGPGSASATAGLTAAAADGHRPPSLNPASAPAVPRVSADDSMVGGLPSPSSASPASTSSPATASAPSTTAAAPSTTAAALRPFAPARSYSSHIKSDAALLAALADGPAAYARGMGSVLDSIIKIYTVHSRPNYTLPWQNHPKRESTGTGFVVHDRLILTNAHVVADATYVLVKRHGSGTKYRADVQAVGHDCDLALLSVEDESFWTSPTAMLPLELGPVPELQQGVVVVGYPTGGDNTSVTSGVVSRVEVAQYAHAASHLMACQIDAAINPGNSGGPALQGDQVVGVAFQNLPGAENIGYIIPTPVVGHFLSEVRKYGSYQGYCSLGVLCQNLENPHLRAALGMSEGMTGVLINTIQKTSNAAKVLREGQVLSYDLTVTPNDLLVPVHCYDRLPSYYMFAGLVFVPLTQPYLHEYGDDWMNTAPRRLYDKAMHGMVQKPGQQVVILSQVLVDDVNTGYQQFQSLQVLRVDGVEVLNLAHLKQLVEGGTTPAPAAPAAGADGANGGAAVAASGGGRYVRFELEDERVLVVDRYLAGDANRRIMERYRVPSSVSADIAG
ncbi:hypothetical protein GPECTOR_252g630 [Gonium pectorale]|uniref:Protease Do-like PDZ domain-containing protein n=1 Tax=Gonium pectorale TaxID=33097 RepID=A0A150FW86_GONPE|nr:hypothetical protein GPECTOR_252g630 [Gonium pectorale]|eukprot:KXZ41883.1 hypothetical protein GPECTOR_252g630 [Gonium pectorale]